MTENITTTTPAPTSPTKIYHLDYDGEGNAAVVKEETINHRAVGRAAAVYEPFKSLTETTMNGHVYKTRLFENLLTQPDSANILRSDIRMVAFTAFNSNPRTFGAFADIVSSMKPQEEYLRDAAIGLIPVAPSGTEAPMVGSGFEGGVTIVNALRRARARILMDWVRFDQIGKIRQVAQEMGLAGRMTEEYAVYNHISTTGNYTRNSTTSDNDVGANQQTLTFNAVNLRTAMAVISTAKDRKSGAYLGYSPDTLITTPLNQIAALQLLQSVNLQRTHGNTTAEAMGTGTTNPFIGLVRQIVVSPWFGASHQWALCDSTRGTLKFQEVEAFNVFQQTQIADNQAWFVLDTLEYLLKGYFGVGFTDDRAWFYSDSTTAATVA